MSKKKATYPIEFNIDRCFVDWYEIDFSQRVYVCRSRDYSGPVGMVWGTVHYSEKEYTRFDVYGSHVPDFLRRKGIRTLINKTILSHFLVVSSPGSTADGKKFMTAAKYKQDRVLGWVLKKPNKASKSKLP